MRNRRLNRSSRRLKKLTDCVIRTRGAVKTYGRLNALDGVSVNVRRGEIYGLIGDNGAGKTTLLKAIVGHIFLSQGEVSVLGSENSRSLSSARRQIGAMIEKVGCFPNLSVEKNMEYCRILKGIPDRKKTAEILEVVGLSHKAKSKCSQLSMGMKQRLGLAIALIGEPQILILDEPINGLDPSGIHEFRELLKSLNARKNITILLSSHILSELQQTATTFGFLSNGKLIEEVSAGQLAEKCADYIEISVSDAEAYAALLDKYLSDENYIVTPSGKLRLVAPKRAPEVYSRLAAQNGILVTGLEHHNRSLEDYYMHLKEGAHA